MSDSETRNGNPERLLASAIRRRAVIAQRDADLANVLRELVVGGPPARHEPPEPPPPSHRVWQPSDSGISGVPVARIVRRHPEMLGDRFMNLPTMHIKKKTRSMFRGRPGRLHSRKMGRTMYTRTDLTFDFLSDCEADPKVRFACEEPVRLRYWSDGWRTHIPDAYVRSWTDSEELIEITWEAEASLPENEDLWRRIGSSVAQLGITYRVLTERNIRRQPRFGNIETLFADRLAPLPPSDLLNQLATALATERVYRVEDIIAQFPQLRPKHVHVLILRNYLETDLDLRLTSQSIVRSGRRLLALR